MNLGRRRAKLAREALELEQEMSERIDVGPSEHVVILVRKLKKAVTALEGEVEKLGPGPKQFFAQAKYLANENMRIWGRVAPILLFGSPVTSFWNKPAEAFID